MSEDKNTKTNDISEPKEKKKLITEKITGRKLTLERGIRYVCLAAACGAVFGIACALTFCGVNMLSNTIDGQGGLADEHLGGIYMEGTDVSFSDNENGDNIDPEGTDAADTLGNDDGTNESGASGLEGETDAKAGSLETEIGTDGGEGIDASESETADLEANETAAENTQTADNSEDSSGSDLENENAISSAEDIKAQRDKVIQESSVYFVSVNATSTGTTWFDNEESSTETFSGVVISADEEEILILTTDGAAGSETIHVTFDNGITMDAYVKQFSEKDGLTVLAVSAENGMDETVMNGLKGIEIAPRGSIINGEPVIACGAPLGVTGSYSFGDICYINDAEAVYDAAQRVLYADVYSDAAKGTFIIDYEGRLIGIASEQNGVLANSEGFTRIVACSSLNDTIDSLKNGEKIAYIGIEGTDITFEMKYNGIPEGCYITDVEQNSPAYQAGIMRGDIICRIGDTDVSNVSEYTRALREIVPGSSIEVTAKRSSAGEYRDMTFTVTVGER